MSSYRNIILTHHPLIEEETLMKVIFYISFVCPSAIVISLSFITFWFSIETLVGTMLGVLSGCNCIFGIKTVVTRGRTLISSIFPDVVHNSSRIVCEIVIWLIHDWCRKRLITFEYSYQHNQFQIWTLKIFRLVSPCSWFYSKYCWLYQIHIGTGNVL